jgi:hypothetical protein
MIGTVSADTHLLHNWFQFHNLEKLQQQQLAIEIGIESYEDLSFLQTEDLISIGIDSKIAFGIIANTNINTNGISEQQWQDKQLLCKIAPEHCAAIFYDELSQPAPRCSALISTDTDTAAATQAIASFTLQCSTTNKHCCTMQSMELLSHN